MRHAMRLELTRVDLLVKLANHYTTKGAHDDGCSDVDPNAIFTKYSMYIFTNISDNGNLIYIYIYI